VREVPGPAQGVTGAIDQGTASLVDSHMAAETTPVDRQISTKVIGIRYDLA